MGRVLSRSGGISPLAPRTIEFEPRPLRVIASHPRRAERRRRTLVFRWQLLLLVTTAVLAVYLLPGSCWWFGLLAMLAAWTGPAVVGARFATRQPKPGRRSLLIDIHLNPRRDAA